MVERKQIMIKTDFSTFDKIDKIVKEKGLTKNYYLNQIIIKELNDNGDEKKIKSKINDKIETLLLNQIQINELILELI